jgi:diaminobutyrate-2-oxoglutarate transaminase
VFKAEESEVRSYSRIWPARFAAGRGSHLTASDGRVYLDFFAGAGALNYGHNEPHIRQALLDYLASDGLVHSLDMHTEAKDAFLEAFGHHILHRRGLSYRVQFCGPTGTNSVEAALKIARKVTGRMPIVAFSRGFHGMSLGSLAATGSASKRRGAGVPLNHVIHLPYENALPDVDGLSLLEYQIEDSSSGVDLPAAVIVETVQAEGGVNVASIPWLQRLSRICREHGILLIVDDIQMGCGRTGPFFSWESSGVRPDIVCLSKSLSGYGLPFAVTLLSPELDVWSPGEHNGTFRGHNLAFVGARVAIERYWTTDDLERGVQERAHMVEQSLGELAQAHPADILAVRGRGLIWGAEFREAEAATAVSRVAFERQGLIVETVGSRGQVIKLIPALTIDKVSLADGLERLKAAVQEVARAGSLVAG